LIAAIMVTDFAFDGFRFALASSHDPGIAHERSYAFVGDAIANVLSKQPSGVLIAGYQLSYWTQMLTALAFLVILPIGEHFHIVTALPTLYFRRGAPANRVPTVELDAFTGDGDSDALKLGVRTARDLTWKEGLDAFTCTECGRCKDACPTFLSGKPLSLKWVHDGLKRHLLAQREAIVGAGGETHEELPSLVGSVISPETLWACTTCG